MYTHTLLATRLATVARTIGDGCRYKHTNAHANMYMYTHANMYMYTHRLLATRLATVARTSMRK